MDPEEGMEGKGALGVVTVTTGKGLVGECEVEHDV